MFQRLGVFVAFSVFSICSVQAGKNPNRISPTTNFLLSDTTDIQSKKDSLKGSIASVSPNDPKSGFKNLFVESPVAAVGVAIAQLNPLAISFVEDYMSKNSKDMDQLKDWGKPIFDMMDDILEKHDLPKELKYLAVIESRLKTNAVSWAGAVGPWQLMPSTGRMLGLKVTRKVDERRDIYKSTHAASKYLVDLYELYGDWLLVIAAYNGGPGAVNSAIRRSGSRDFWTLQKYLPAESRKHVKKFIATHYIMEGVGGVTTLTKDEASDYLAAVADSAAAAAKKDSVITAAQFINGRYSAVVISRYVMMDIATFHLMNPDFEKAVAVQGKYQLRLPVEKMDVFKARKLEILYESLQLLVNPLNATVRE